MDESEPFTKKMRKVTRNIHNVSDTLINAKLGLAMSDNKVWAEGLLIFYEIFKYLEGSMDRLKNTALAELDIEGMRRTTLFEQDLEYYMGKEWKKNYIPRPSVTEYLIHLRQLEENNPVLLTAYIYHLYMGLLSGGQILKKKRAVVLRLTFSRSDPEGLAVVDMKDKSAYQMKKAMHEAMNRVAESLDEETRQLLLEESKMVFILNNKMVRSIEGVNHVVINKFVVLTCTVAFIGIIVYYFHSSLLHRKS